MATKLDEGAGRGLEIVVGFITALICLAFLLGFIAFIVEGNWVTAALVAALICLIFSYIFGVWSYRLLTNKKRKDGGLLSSWAIQFWCIILSISSLFMAYISFLENNLMQLVSFLISTAVFIVGFRVASNRKKSNEI